MSWASTRDGQIAAMLSNVEAKIIGDDAAPPSAAIKARELMHPPQLVPEDPAHLETNG